MAQLDDDGVQQQARQLAARLEPRINKLAREIVEWQRAAIPGLDRLPAEIHDLERAATVRRAIRFFLRYVQGDADTERDTVMLRERAAQRAEDGVPLVTLIRSYHVGAEALMSTLSSAARSGEEPALVLLSQWLLTALNHTVEQVTESYLAGLADQHAAARELARALLHGEEPEAVADRYGLTVEPGYTVLGVRFHRAAPPVAARRLMRQVLGRLTPLAEGRVLSLPGEHGGLILLPADITHTELVQRLEHGLPHQPIVGAALAQAPQDVPAAAEQALRITRLVTAPGVYRLHNVLLEYHLARPDDSAAELLALLAPLQEHPGLTETLKAFLDEDLDRHRTANALAVHPNTVNNRLARVVEITGVNPRTTKGVQLFGAALALSRLAERT